MTVKDFLHQAYRLDQRIKSDTCEVREIQMMAESVSAVQYDQERVQTSNRPDAPFVHTLERLWDMQDKIADELAELSALKDQIREVIDTVQDTDEQLVLKYRYVHNMTWEQIGNEMHADRSTIYRWHGNALKHATLPEDPIRI